MRDVSALEVTPGSGQQQPFWELDNCFVEMSAMVEREAGLYKRTLSVDPANVDQVKFFSSGRLCWIESDGAGMSLAADTGARADQVYALEETPTLVRGNGAVYAMCSGYDMYEFDGVNWNTSTAPVLPGFGVYAKNRLWVAGLPDKPLEVHASRAGSYNIFTENENPESTAKTKAAFIDISEVVGTSDEIVALGTFDGDRLAIFLKNKTIIYKISEDYDLWVLDVRSTMEIGALSPRAICSAGQDLLFGTRSGIHRLSRSDVNGLTVQQRPITRSIKKLYRKLVKDTINPLQISSFFDTDDLALHFFFPRYAGECIRLTAYVDDSFELINWSTGSFMKSSCGDALGGDLAFGTFQDGFWVPDNRVINYASITNLDVGPTRAKMRAVTPMLWLGNMYEEKETNSILLHASGTGKIAISAANDDGDTIFTKLIEISPTDGDDTSPSGVPLVDEYRIPFRYKIRGLTLTIETEDEDVGDVHLIGFAVELKKET